MGDKSMCRYCDDLAARHAAPASRRFFLGSAAAAATLALAPASFAQYTAPKPQNAISPDAALDRLREGNARYVSGLTKRHDFKHEREPLATGQNPYASILSCADSRIAPEYAFDCARGDLFVCRVAGNFVNDDVLASFEYGVAVLGVPLLMVLGHESCGAVGATIKSLKDGTTLPGRLPSLVTALGPAVKETAGQPGDALENATRRNVVKSVAKLEAATPIIAKAVAEKKLRVVGGIYHLKTGRVEVLA